MPDHPSEPLSRRLARLREAAGFSQYALAQKSGVARQVIHRIEKGERTLTVETLRRLAAALDASLGDFQGCTD